MYGLNLRGVWSLEFRSFFGVGFGVLGLGFRVGVCCLIRAQGSLRVWSLGFSQSSGSRARVGGGGGGGCNYYRA